MAANSASCLSVRRVLLVAGAAAIVLLVAFQLLLGRALISQAWVLSLFADCGGAAKPAAAAEVGALAEPPWEAPWHGASRQLERLGCRPWARQPATPRLRMKEALAACPVEAMALQHLTRDPDGRTLISMSTGMCPLYFLAGASVTSGAAVEFGTWAGGSTRCIAAGVNITGGSPGRVFGFDAFLPGKAKANMDTMLSLSGGTRFDKEIRAQTFKFDMMKVFLFYTQEVYPSIQAVRVGDFLKDSPKKLRSGWRNQGLDFWCTDSAKGWERTLKQLEIVRPFLNEGAIIVLADFMAKDTPAFVYSALVESLELLTFWPGSYEFVFGLKKPLAGMSQEEGERIMGQRTPEHWNEVRDRLKADMARVYQPGLSALRGASSLDEAFAWVDRSFASLR